MTNTNFNNITIINKAIKNNNYIDKNYNINKIKIWTGNTPPSGYVWCDGNNGTPNLKNKFIYFINHTSNTLGNVGNNTINSIPTHNHNVSSVSINSDIVNTTNLLRINNLYYLRYNRTAPLASSGSRRSDSTPSIDVHKNHFHNINNNDVNSNSFKNDIIIENFSPTNTLNIVKQNDLTTNNIVSSGVVQQGSQEDFEPKYIYIGFIMKI